MLFNVASDLAGGLVTISNSGFKTMLSGLAQTATLRRGKLTEVAIGPWSNPVTQDCNIVYAIHRTVGIGTGSAVVPIYVPALEGGTPPAPGSSWAVNHSVEGGTLGNRMWTKAINQHSGFIWYAPDEIGLPWPATNNNGLACQAKGATADSNGSTVFYEVKFDE